MNVGFMVAIIAVGIALGAAAAGAFVAWQNRGDDNAQALISFAFGLPTIGCVGVALVAAGVGVLMKVAGY